MNSMVPSVDLIKGWRWSSQDTGYYNSAKLVFEKESWHSKRSGLGTNGQSFTVGSPDDEAFSITSMSEHDYIKTGHYTGPG